LLTAKVSTTPPLPQPPVAKAYTKPPPPPPPPHVDKANSSDAAMAKARRKEEHIKLLLDNDKSLDRSQVILILEKSNWVFFDAQKVVRSKMLSKDTKLQAAAYDSDGTSDDNRGGYISDGEWEDIINKGKVLMELSVGYTIKYDHLLFGTTREATIFSIKNRKLVLRAGYILEASQLVWTKGLLPDQKL
jgi:hypothetical protein